MLPHQKKILIVLIYLVTLFIESCKYCYELMEDGGSILTLTYYGAGTGNASLQRYGSCKVSIRGL